jgi:hypothetical protein
MKKILVIAILCIVGISCQTEELVVNNAPQDNLVADAQLAGKLLQMAQYPTAIDNVVDNTSCFSLQLPFTVVVNGQTLVVDAVSDYQVIRDILDASSTDNDSVTIQFPINITYADYSTATLQTQSELNAAVTNCVSSIELSCISLGFPLGVNTYDSENQIADTFDLNNEQALFEFLQTISIYDAVTLNYPISFTAPDGTVTSISNNDGLETAIDNFTDECLAGVDPGPGPGPDPTFDDIITDGTWYVSYFFRDQDDTDDYENYDFTFNDNGTVTVTGGSGSTGTWATFIDSGDLELDLTFTASALDELAEDWTVIDYSPTLIKLQKVSGGGDDIRSLHFTKN